MKTDSSGIVEWNQTYGGIYDEFAFALVQTTDGGFALVGTTFGLGQFDADMLLVKIARDPTLTTSTETTQPQETDYIITQTATSSNKTDLGFLPALTFSYLLVVILNSIFIDKLVRKGKESR
ncbi:MAG: hypothetical protein IH840_09615 [Candidatus Heimdallarchaeota archaeon]|nr:hypothetical protein [Candidatus Heimdallarchaeota archaeon]